MIYVSEYPGAGQYSIAVGGYAVLAVAEGYGTPKGLFRRSGGDLLCPCRQSRQNATGVDTMRLRRVRLVSYAVHPGPHYEEYPPVVRTSVSGAQNLRGLCDFFRGTLPLLPSKYGGAAQFNFRACSCELWRPVVNVGAGLCARPLSRLNHNLLLQSNKYSIIMEGAP